MKKVIKEIVVFVAMLAVGIVVYHMIRGSHL
jgi:hypothetical protein